MYADVDVTPGPLKAANQAPWLRLVQSARHACWALEANGESTSQPPRDASPASVTGYLRFCEYFETRVTKVSLR